MKKYLLLFSCLPFAAANAQITITSADVAVASNVIYQSVDTMPSVSAGSAGASQSWNMSVLNTHSVDTLGFQNLGWVPDQTTFPTSNLVMQYGYAYQYAYIINNSTGMTTVGSLAEVDLGNGPTIIKQVNSPAEKLATFPSTYNTSFSNNFTQTTQFYYGMDPGIGFTVDSVRQVSQIEKTSLCDAWGNITTPLGTFPALRFKEVKASLDSTFGYIAGFGWVPFEGVEDTTETYVWWANGVGFPLVQTEMDRTDGSVARATWLQAMPAVGIDESSAASASIAYPNPASSVITISTLVAADLATVYDAQGRLVAELSVNNGNVSIGLEDFSAGLYTYSILDKNKGVLSHGKFTVSK
jgi:hypothetical protein